MVETASLAQARELLDTVVEAVPAAIAVVRGSEFRHTLVNRAYRAMAPGRVFLGRTVAETWPEMAGRVLPLLSAVLDTGQPFQVEDMRFDLCREGSGPAGERYFSFAYERLPEDSQGRPGILITGLETTSRVKDRRQIEESASRLRRHIRTTPLAEVEWDSEYRVTNLSPRAETMFGWTAAEVLGKRIDEIPWIPEEDWPSVRAVMRDMSSGARPANVNANRNLRKDGTEIHSEWYNSALLDDGGKLVSVLSLVLDVTARNNAVDSLRSARDYLENLLDHASVPIIVWDAGRKITLFNQAFERMTGYSAADVIGADLEMLLPGESRGESLRRIAAAAGGSGWESVEIPVRCRNGEIRVVLWNSAIVNASGGASAKATIAQGQDITERKRGEEELRRLEAAVTQTPASIVVTDAEGRIQYVNPAFERITGYSRHEAIGQKPSILKSGKQDDEFYRSLWVTIAAGHVWTGRIVNKTKAGLLFTEDAVIAPVRDASGAIRSYVAVKRDITAEMETQRQLQDVLKLESVGRLAGGIAHDFNNLLTIILGGAEFLKDNLRGAGAVSMEAVDDIRAAGERARDLTGKLLAFARRQVIEPVPLILNVLVRDSERLLRRLLREDIVLVVNLEAGLWTTRLDPTQVEQVLLNLATNAGDAMPGGGRLTIETANFEATEMHAALHPGIRPGPYVRLVVQDSGMGMTPAVVARIFEPFFTTKPVGKGTGLGLATVYGIVKQSGGFIRVESEPGYGTSFELLFPGATEAEVDRTMPVPTPSARGSETIVLVEDDAGVRKVALRALRAAGYRVLEAATGAEAVEILAGHDGRLDLLLTDVVMPGVDGMKVADEAGRRSQVPSVLFMSGHAHDVLALHGALPEQTDLLPKPFTTTTLLERVRRALDGEAARGGGLSKKPGTG